MVYALKSYSRNSQYQRRSEKNVLDILMQRFSNTSSYSYQSIPAERKSFVDKSVQKLAINSIIEGYFPKENVVRQMAIKRVNKMLGIAIATLITVAVVSD